MEQVDKNSKEMNGEPQQGSCAVDIDTSQEGKGDDLQLEKKYMEAIEQVELHKNKAEEYLDLARRGQADFDNYKKRMGNAAVKAYKEGASDIVKQILPVLDNLERAVNAEAAQGNQDTITAGVEQVLKQFINILGKEGVEQIEALGRQFDPQLHEAVMAVERQEGQEENTIVEVIQKGYKMNDRVIRHSIVKVAK